MFKNRENIVLRNFQILYYFIFKKVTTFELKLPLNIPPRNTNIYIICKLRNTIFSVFYSISPLNFGVLHTK